jgi:hypothetical protein
MYYTGIDPFTKKSVQVATHLKDRKLQRALLQYFKPENYFEVRAALLKAGRGDLIGKGCDCLIPATPPREAILKRRTRANERFRGEFVHTVPVKKKNRRKESRHSPGRGYRPDTAKSKPRSRE